MDDVTKEMIQKIENIGTEILNDLKNVVNERLKPIMYKVPPREFINFLLRMSAATTTMFMVSFINEIKIKENKFETIFDHWAVEVKKECLKEFINIDNI